MAGGRIRERGGNTARVSYRTRGYYRNAHRIDDLRDIRGLGCATAARIHELGILSFSSRRMDNLV